MFDEDSNEPPEWAEWDAQFAKAGHLVDDMQSKMEAVQAVCLNIVVASLPLYLAWQNTITAEHIDKRLATELEREEGDKPRALFRALKNRLRDDYTRRHANDFFTDMRGSLLFLHDMLDKGKWKPSHLPLEENEIREKLYEYGGTTEPGDCLGMVRDRWDNSNRNKPKATKTKAKSKKQQDDEPRLFVEPTTDRDIELAKIRHVLSIYIKQSKPLENLDPPKDRDFYIAVGMDGGQRHELDKRIVTFILRALAKRW